MEDNKKYVVAVSSGPDSMALLNMCINQNLDIVVCHVNYRKRKTSDEEMMYIEKFCKDKNIKCFILNEEYTFKGNFQKFAREYRYDFFKKTLEKEQCNSVLIAHHEDDLIETYLMQKQKNIVPNTYGLNEINYYKDIKIERPLLNLTKKQLENYCIENKIKFYIDESNLKDDYTRNKIRHNIVEKLSEEERYKIIYEIKTKNIIKNNLEEKIKVIVQEKFEVENYKNLEEVERLCFLRLFFKKYINEKNYSNSYFKQIDKNILSNKNFSLTIEDKEFVKNYTVCEIVGIKDKKYKFIVEFNMYFDTEYFKLKKEGKRIEGVGVKNDEWPLTIRNYQDGDKIKLKFGTKKINRWFIDNKIPAHKRKIWPVVLNNKNEIIMVPQIGCNNEHYTIKPTVFVIK